MCRYIPLRKFKHKYHSWLLYEPTFANYCWVLFGNFDPSIFHTRTGWTIKFFKSDTHDMIIFSLFWVLTLMFHTFIFDNACTLGLPNFLLGRCLKLNSGVLFKTQLYATFCRIWTSFDHASRSAKMCAFCWNCFSFSLKAQILAGLDSNVWSSVQAEKKKIATTTFLDAWDLRSHMAGHFHLWHAVFSYHPGLLGPSS